MNTLSSNRRLVLATMTCVDGSGNTKLRVSFYRPFYGDYWILAIDPAYEWVLVGEPQRKFAWVLAKNLIWTKRH